MQPLLYLSDHVTAATAPVAVNVYTNGRMGTNVTGAHGSIEKCVFAVDDFFGIILHY